MPVIAIALAVGALAGMMAWLDGPSEGLLRIGREQGYLPPYFQRVNRQGIEVRILAAQGVVITVIALLYAFIPTVSHAYWIFAVMATQVYMIMYVLMFIAAMQAAALATGSRARLPCSGAWPAVHGRRYLVRGRVRDRVRPAIAVRPHEPVVYALLILAGILDDRGPPAAADGPVPQAGVEGEVRDGGGLRRSADRPLVSTARRCDLPAQGLLIIRSAHPPVPLPVCKVSQSTSVLARY